MKQQNEFKEQQSQQHAAELHAAQNTGQEFATAEDLLRYDTKQVTVPPGIAERLQKSSADLPRPGRSWWQRFFKS